MTARYNRYEEREDTFSSLFLWLVFTQIITLASIYFWIEFRLFNPVIARFPGLTGDANPVVLILLSYPFFPMLFSFLAWTGMALRRFTMTSMAMLMATIPALGVVLYVLVTRFLSWI
jgi:hypothetical protein